MFSEIRIFFQKKLFFYFREKIKITFLSFLPLPIPKFLVHLSMYREYIRDATR